MPRNVRNFWLTLNVDGKSSTVATGPRSKDGGFELAVMMRDGGDILRAVSMRGYWFDGKLILEATAVPDRPGDLEQEIKIVRCR